ncbi:MAG: aspartate--tRNA ligase [Bacteroidales bacterium]|nr:aspartate--tRNA ligase [Bacteroidales bacterium]
MYRTHTCGELKQSDINKEVTLSGWVQKIRNLGAVTFIDIRDRYGITQLFFDKETNPKLTKKSEELGREFVIRVEGKVTERSSKNPEITTGDIEITVTEFNILSKSEIPPFTIEDNTDGGEEIRLKYRYLDLRRNTVQKGIILRHRMAQEVRKYLNEQDFLEIETPFLIKSTPEGARDFVVPSRMSEGKFYALPQSPQVFKQLLMISGYDKYFQLIKCFRDEDFRADRQPEFTQIDCEMSFVEREDILTLFEGLAKHLFSVIKGKSFTEQFPRITYDDALNIYGSDRPDIRFEMKITDLSEIVKGNGFNVFDNAEFIGGIYAEGLSGYSRKQTDELIKWVQRPQIGAKGLVFAKYNEDGTFKSSVDKFYSQEDIKKWADAMNAKPGDLMLLMSGNKKQILIALGELRLEMGSRLDLRNDDEFAPLWIVDFPLFEKDEETGQMHAVHHPFTSPKKDQFELIDSHPESIKAEAYDLVINGNEIGGGSIRIHETELQEKMFRILGFTDEEAEAQFGFLMNAFKYGAPPHGGIAFGFDRWVALFNGSDSIRDIIAFPKNNAGRDIMIDAPASIDDQQLKDLNLKIIKKD